MEEKLEQIRQEAFMEGYQYAIKVLSDNIVKTRVNDNAAKKGDGGL